MGRERACVTVRETWIQRVRGKKEGQGRGEGDEGGERDRKMSSGHRTVTYPPPKQPDSHSPPIQLACRHAVEGGGEEGRPCSDERCRHRELGSLHEQRAVKELGCRVYGVATHQAQETK